MTTDSLPARRRIRRVRASYNLVTGAYWFATAPPLSLVVLYAQSRGFDLFQVGIYTSVYALTVAAMEVPSGMLADMVGRKRVAMLAYGASLCATTLLLFAFSMPVLIGFALLYGVSRALHSGTLQAWFVDALLEADPKVDLQPPLAVAGTFELLGLAAGTLIGGFLPVAFGHLPSEGLITPLAVPLLASVAVKVLVVVAVALLIRERRVPHGAAASRRSFLWSSLKVIRDAVVLLGARPILPRLLASAALSGVALIGVETFWQPFFAEHLGSGTGMTGVLGMLFAGCFAVGMVGKLLSVKVSGWLGRRHGQVAALFQGTQVVALLLLTQQGTLPAAIACFWLVYLAMAGGRPSEAALLHQEVPSERRAVMLSVHSMAAFIGASTGSLLLGLVVRSGSIPMAWALAAGLLAGSVVLLLSIDRSGGRIAAHRER